MVTMCESSEKPFSTVSVSVLPRHAQLVVTRKAALHLYRLLQRYNWCLKEQPHYRERWAGFWPNISAIERKLLTLLILANCGGVFGSRMQAINVPVDFEPFEEDARPVGLTSDIAAEFRRILTLHYARLATPGEIRQRWLERRPKEYALLVSLGVIDGIVTDDAIGLHPDLIGERAKSAYLAGGWCETSAGEMSGALALELEWFFNSKEELLC